MTELSLLFHLTIALALTSITTFALGVFVYFSTEKSSTGKIFFLYCLSISWWSFFQIWHHSVGDPGISRAAAQLMTAGGSFFIPTLFVHFVTSLLDIGGRKKLLIALYPLSAIFAVLSGSDVMVGEVSPRFFLRNLFQPGPVYYVGVVFFVGCILYGHILLYRHYVNSRGIRKNQLAYLFWSSLFGYIGGGANFLFVFGINIPVLSPFGTYAVPLYVAATTYSIVRYRLMEISVVLRRGLAYAILLAIIFSPLYLSVLISARATAYSVPPLLAATLIFACGLWIFFYNPRGSPNVSFSLVTLGVSTWLFSSFMMYSTSDSQEAAFWGRITYAGVVFIPAAFYHFSVSFLQRPGRKWPVAFQYLMGAGFLALLPSNLLVDGVYSYFWGYYVKAGAAHPLFLAYFGCVSGLSLIKLYQGYREKEVQDPVEARRAKYIFWSFVIGYVASIDFLQNYGIEFYPAGYLFVSLWVMIVTFAIVRYQLLDISIILSRAAFLRSFQFFLIVPIYLVVVSVIFAFTGEMHFALAGVLTAILPFFSGFVRSLQQQIENVIGKVLFRERYDSYDTLKDFSKAMVNILDLKDLNNKIIITLSRVMGIDKVSLFLLVPGKDIYSTSIPSQKEEAGNGTKNNHSEDIKISGKSRLPRYLKEANELVVKEEMEHWLESYPNEDIREIVQELSKIQSELCIPLMNKDHLIGFLSLGRKHNNSMYTREDVNLLATLAQNAAIALDNALLYEDLKQQKILMRRTDRMRSLETMAGGFAHEIRNPLTSIKTFVQLAPQRRDDEEFVDHFSKVVSEDVHRIERLIQEILDYARYMQPRMSEEDLNDVVESSLYFIGVKSEGKGITVEKELAADLPRVLIDRQQIKQVLLNLFLNAMDAMPEGGKLIVRTHRLHKSAEEEWVQIEVTDTGSGISEDDLEHIFDPFFTTKHESKEREGTGLGLSIVHQIIQEHRGHIDVTSKPRYGTTFYVSLPVNPVRFERRKPDVQVT